MSIPIVVEYDFLTVATKDYLADHGEADEELTNELRNAVEGAYSQEQWDDARNEWLDRRFPDYEPVIVDGPVLWRGCTYNEDNYLDQDFVWTLWEHDSEVYAIIQLGVFSTATPTVYRIEEWERLLSWGRGTGQCAACLTVFSLEDAYSLHQEDPPGEGMTTWKVEDLATDGTIKCPLHNCSGHINLWTE